MMNRADLSTSDEVFFVAGHAGVSDSIPSKPICDYNGWSEPGELYCKKRGHLLMGIPREILRQNWCPSCCSRLYPVDDLKWLDTMGYWLYRTRVDGFTRYAIDFFSDLIPGETFESHIDHILSVRDGFEHGTPETVVAAPVNLRWIPASTNLRKGRKSEKAIEELIDEYTAFAQQHPVWDLLMTWADTEESKYMAATRSRDEKKALLKWLKERGVKVILE